MKLIQIVALVAACLLLLFLGTKIFQNWQFHKQVCLLFAGSPRVSHQVFQFSQIQELPEPVQKYFRLVIPERQAYISTIRLKHKGQFKTGLDNPWTDITGEQYFTGDRPGFVWEGTTTFMSARDMFLEDRGRLVVSLFGMIPFINAHGTTYDEGELQRWVVECIWFPTSLLPNERLSWDAIDARHARLNFHFQGIKVAYLVTFNATGEIVQMETQRYMNEEKRETWIGKMHQYEERNGILIPTNVEVAWKIDGIEKPYANFTLTKIEYGVGEVW